ncbi:unnamed protein product, partial [Heterobilharzia americana]
MTIRYFYIIRYDICMKNETVSFQDFPATDEVNYHECLSELNFWVYFFVCSFLKNALITEYRMIDIVYEAFSGNFN